MCRVRLPSTHVFVVRGGVHIPELSESDRCWRTAAVRVVFTAEFPYGSGQLLLFADRSAELVTTR